MICDKCHKRNADIYIKTVINGHIQMAGLCEKCASAIQGDYVDDTAFDIFGNTKNQAVACSACGTRLSDIIKSGYFGCENCCKQFRDYISPMIRRMHGVDVHKGKLPKDVPLKVKLIYKKRKLIEEREKYYMAGDIKKSAAIDAEIAGIDEEIRRRGDGR